MHLLPVYMHTVHVCLMLHMYNVQCTMYSVYVAEFY